jgi:hypothetical protein
MEIVLRRKSITGIKGFGAAKQEIFEQRSTMVQYT